MLSIAVKDKVKEFIAKGQKITAIKYLREQYPLSLQDAAHWVDFLSGETKVKPSAFPAQDSHPLTAVAKKKVKSLIHKGKYTEAIKYLRDEYQLSLEQSKQLIDLVASELETSVPRMKIKSTTLAMYILALLGTIFWVIALYFLWKDYHITHDSVTVTGTVIELQYDQADHGSGAIPVVEYSWKGNKKIHYGTTYSNPPAVDIGEEVEVIISRKDPSLSILNLLSERYFLIFIFGILGLVFNAIGYVGLFYKFK